MTLEYSEQLEYILGTVSLGVAIFDARTLRLRYANTYLRTLLDPVWQLQELRGHSLEDLAPQAIYQAALPILHYVTTTGQRVQYEEVPYEGFLETRGRTYWRIVIEPSPIQEKEPTLFMTLEDVTNAVRSRLHLNAIHHISSAIAGGAALSLVLDRILQALQDMVGSKRCAILLLDQSLSESEPRFGAGDLPRTAIIAAQKGLHPYSYNWQPLIDESTLPGRVERAGRTLIITDTSTTPELDLPDLYYHGEPRRPGSVLCVPIFEPQPRKRTGALRAPGARTLLGTIEVYHRRTRGFSSEEVGLLEQFAQQAGLALQTARLFRGIDRWARAASRNARQKENVMQAIPDSVLIFDPRWRVADVNQAARTLFGWSEDMQGVPIHQALEQSTVQLPRELFGQPDLIQLLEKRALMGIVDEMKLVDSTKRSYTFRCSYTPIRDELGDIFAFIIIFHDVSEEVAARERIEAEVVARTTELAQRNRALQQAKAALEQTSDRMELLLEQMPSGVLQVSAHDHTIMLINDRAIQQLHALGVPLMLRSQQHENEAQQILGIDSDLLLRDISMYSSNGTLVPFEEQPLYRALIDDEASEAELHATQIDGRPIFLLINAAPLHTPDGSIASAILVLHEISKLKTLERAREDFFTTMAHELKTPLANIRAHLSALLAHDLQWSSEEQAAFLQTADEQVERLVRMINQFLDASRVEAGALRLQLEPILLPELFEDLEERLQALIASSKRQLRIDLDDTIPAVLGDYEMLMSVLTNLLSNAFRYAPEGDVVQLSAEIVTDEVYDPVAVTLRVTDRGPGLSEAQQLELFTRFSTFAEMSRSEQNQSGQAPPERRRGGGRWSPATGLGLYISRGIIEAHGSDLTLKSSPGQGASFAFTLPVFSDKQSQEGQKNRR